jgi:hypothetical protein
VKRNEKIPYEGHPLNKSEFVNIIIYEGGKKA